MTLWRKFSWRSFAFVFPECARNICSILKTVIQIRRFKNLSRGWRVKKDKLDTHRKKRKKRDMKETPENLQKRENQQKNSKHVTPNEAEAYIFALLFLFFIQNGVKKKRANEEKAELRRSRHKKFVLLIIRIDEIVKREILPLKRHEKTRGLTDR